MKKTYLLIVCTLTFLLTGIYGQCDLRSTMTPADRSMNRYNSMQMDTIDETDDMMNDEMMTDDTMMTKKKGYTAAEENIVYKSLSPKSQKAFKTLSREDKQKVIDAYNNGGDPVRTIYNILQNDKKNGNTMNNGNGSMNQNNKGSNTQSEEYNEYSMDDNDMGCQLEESPAVKTMRKKEFSKPCESNDNIFY